MKAPLTVEHFLKSVIPAGLLTRLSITSLDFTYYQRRKSTRMYVDGWVLVNNVIEPCLMSKTYYVLVEVSPVTFISIM